MTTLPVIHAGYSLQSRNTLNLPSIADYFAAPTSVAALRQLVEAATACQMPLTVLGEGSNVILQARVPGLVIQPALRGIRKLHQSDNSVLVEVAAGENWDAFVHHCLQQGWFGLENLSLIPGTAGAAPVQNIGAYGVELQDLLEAVDVLDLHAQAVTQLSADQCEFGYRESVFKNRAAGRYCITAVRFRLALAEEDVKLDYGDLRAHVERLGKPTPARVREAVCAIRRAKLPDPAELPNAGSFFKNPVVTAMQFAQLKARFPELPGYPVTSPLHGGDAAFYKIAAGWLIEHAGYKGKRIGHLGMHHKQALVLVNYGGASYQDVMTFSDQLVADILDRYGVRLQREPGIVPPVCDPHL